VGFALTLRWGDAGPALAISTAWDVSVNIFHTLQVSLPPSDAKSAGCNREELPALLASKHVDDHSLSMTAF